MRSRRWRIAAAAGALFVFTWVFRFNTLGGSYGGFENDHFVPFAYAKQVQAGEQPLRDFTGLGLQAAWPSLTYEVSAAGQRLFGDTLRSEALVTVTAMAVAAAATCGAAAVLAPLGWSVALSLAAVLLQPTLYNYPKALVFGLLGLAVCAHARWRGMATAAGLGVLTALAFLFRHDYAVYAGAGCGVVLMAAVPWRRALPQVAAYGVVTGLLLAPSMFFVQRYAGLGHYVRDAAVMSSSEAERTELAWPAFTSRGDEGEPLRGPALLTSTTNAESWLYYLMLATPLAAVVSWRRRVVPTTRWLTPAVWALAATLLVAHWFLLRGNLQARLGDVAPLWAMLGAVACDGAVAGEWRAASRAVGGVLVVAVLVATAAAVGTLGEVAGQLRTAGMYRTEQTVRDQAVAVWQELGGLPDAYWTAETPRGAIAVSQYLNRCTAPDARVMVEAYQPEVLALADRRFAGGRLNYVPGLLTDEAHQREIVDFLRRQIVDIALVEERLAAVFDRDLPVVQAYLRSAYELVGVVPPDSVARLQVWLRRGSVPISTFGAARLPCFR